MIFLNPRAFKVCAQAGAVTKRAKIDAELILRSDGKFAIGPRFLSQRYKYTGACNTIGLPHGWHTLVIECKGYKDCWSG